MLQQSQLEKMASMPENFFTDTQKAENITEEQAPIKMRRPSAVLTTENVRNKTLKNITQIFSSLIIFLKNYFKFIIIFCTFKKAS